MRLQDLLAELRRRHVIRVAAVYAAVAWVVVEVSSTVFPNLALPPWTVTLVTALAVLGFPIALVLAWALELTPEGVRRTPESPTAGEGVATPSAARAPASSGLLQWVLLGAVVLGIGGWIALQSLGDDNGSQLSRDTTLNPRRVVAVPFEDRTGDPELEGIGGLAADWVTRELERALIGVVQLVPDHGGAG